MVLGSSRVRSEEFANYTLPVLELTESFIRVLLFRSINASQFLLSLVILAAGGTAIYLASVNFESQLERFEKVFFDLLDDFLPDHLTDIFGVVSEIASDIFLDGASIDECGCPNVEDCGMSNLEGCQATGDGRLCSIACYSENAVDPDYLVQEALLQGTGYTTEGIRNVFLGILSAAANGIFCCFHSFASSKLLHSVSHLFYC